MKPTEIAAEAAKRIHESKLSFNETVYEIQSAIEKATEETNAANCSLLALAAIVKGHPDTPESLKAIASKELLDHTRGAYLINELRTLRAAHASERKMKRWIIFAWRWFKGPPTTFNHYCRGESGYGGWSHRSNIGICGYCKRPHAREGSSGNASTPSKGAFTSRAAHAGDPLPPPYRTSVLIKQAHSSDLEDTRRLLLKAQKYVARCIGEGTPEESEAAHQLSQAIDAAMKKQK